MMKYIAFLFFLTFSSGLFAWSSHYLVTDISLKPLALNEQIQTESLQDFLQSEKSGIKNVFEQYYKWLKVYNPKRFKKIEFDANNPSVESFLKAARLNPKATFPLVNRILPNQGNTPFKIDDYSFETKNSFFEQNFQRVENQKVSAHSILVSFSDEPDWDIDYALWQYEEEYGYKEQPYGNKTGGTSRAPFHMKFLNENILVRTFAPEITEGMTFDRIKLFSDLAKFAFQTNHPYWGYRFTAWVIHYIQDICQPYHSQANPQADLFYYLNFVFSSAETQKKIKADTSILVGNRHFIYEDSIAVFLADTYKKPTYETLSKALKEENKFLFLEAEEIRYVFEKASFFASGHSSKIDKIIRQTFGKKLTDDPSYDILDDPNYDIWKLLPKLQKNLQPFLKAVSKDFEITGNATRKIVEMITKK